MILLLDIGNTNITIGLVKDDEIIQTYRLNSFTNKTSDEYYLLFKEIINLNDIKQIAISSVVPQITYVINELFMKYTKCSILILEQKIKTGIMVKADNPKEVGADLICDAKGLLGEEALIIDLGTATKYIYVKDNIINGLAIAPGLNISIKALVQDTALLPDIDLRVPKKVLGNNTISCMQSGVIYGTVFAVDGFIDKIKEEINNPNLKVVATGGLASSIIPLCKHDIQIDEHLTLRGLHEIVKKNEE
ncbi:MAG: type III pantothenate kinase [bacterium]